MSMGEMSDSLGFENGQRHGKKHSFSFFLSLLTEYRPPLLRFFRDETRTTTPCAFFF
jgi:hypothetical protein